MPAPKRNADALSPKVLRMQLGQELRRLREAAGISSRDEVAEPLGCHVTKISRVESGQTTLGSKDLELLLKLYKADAKCAKRVRDLGEAARKRGTYGNVPLWAKDYIGIVPYADALKIYYGELIPGPFQTQEYARALVSTSVTATPSEVDRLVSMRACQREIFTKKDPADVRLVLGEAALRRQVGGPEVLRAQLEHLRDLAARENVTLQLLPFSSGGHAALETPFTLLYLYDVGATFAYLEGLTNANLWSHESHILAYEAAFDQLQAAAQSSCQTLDALDQAIKDLK